VTSDEQRDFTSFTFTPGVEKRGAFRSLLDTDPNSEVNEGISDRARVPYERRDLDSRCEIQST
jgi:hypothetical protein